MNIPIRSICSISASRRLKQAKLADYLRVQCLRLQPTLCADPLTRRKAGAFERIPGAFAIGPNALTPPQRPC
jgi:hypothetical protein